MSINLYLDQKERNILESVTIGIAGAGGLGSNCAMHLIRSGIIHLKIVDFDIVSPGNLNRQFFFQKQLGQSKVEALKENLLQINPQANIQIFNQKVTEQNIHTLFDNCDIIVEAFDHAEAKALLIHQFLTSNKKIVAASGLAGWGNNNLLRTTQIGKNLYLIGDGNSEVGDKTGCSPNSPRVGIAAAMQANTVIALLLGYPI